MTGVMDDIEAICRRYIDGATNGMTKEAAREMLWEFQQEVVRHLSPMTLLVLVEAWQAREAGGEAQELAAWRNRFPMCHYDPDAGSIFSDSEPR